DLPLEHTPPGRLLSWTIAALIYLAVLALAVAAVADGALRLYSLRSKLVTVSLPSADDAMQGDRQMSAALGVLQKTRGVTSAIPVPTEELEELIEPWLGDFKSGGDLPLPRLIDVTLDPQDKPDLTALQQRLRQVVAGATVGVETTSSDRGQGVAAFARTWGGAIGVVILLAALATVALLTRHALRSQDEALELLRSIGATRPYLAHQFERHALLGALRGGLIGFALAAITVVALLYAGEGVGLVGTIRLALRPTDWLLLACVPVVSVLLAAAVARMTASWSLSRMP
ncbi:MAG: cell division protein FtsX, partial [Geminicoccales bacterium]